METKDKGCLVWEGGMPTVTEIRDPEIKREAEIKKELRAPVLSRADRISALRPVGPPRVMFSDSLIDSGPPDRRRRGLATTISFVFQCVLIGFLLVLPLMFTEVLPTQQLLTMLIAPPPPPPPPAPAAVVKIVQLTDVLDNGRLRTPSRIPQKIAMIREEEAPPPASSGVVGGIPGGVPGGQLGGVIGGIISSTSSLNSVPKLDMKRVRISQGVTQGMVLRKVEPVYPKIALSAHVTGAVLLNAIIGKDGSIAELHVISGHPMLVQAAIDAVKQWHYRPYLLNGEPVEVETNITVTFEISL
jgi:protein TonB